jgi:BON domain
MFCIQCGARLKEGLKFCINCGAKLEEPSPQAQTPQPRAKDMPSAESTNGSEGSEGIHSGTIFGRIPTSSSISPIRLWSGIILLLVAIVITGFLIYRPSRGAAVSDGDIEKALQSKFAADPNLSKRTLEVRSQKGVVTLIGLVNSDADKSAAASMAAQQEGVKQVNVFGIVIAGQTNSPGVGTGGSDTAYAITGAGHFGTLDLHTGVFTELGNAGVLLGGLGVYRGNLYGGQHNGNTLYQVNPTNGSLTAVGKSNITDFNLFGSTTSGLYALDSNFNLYSVYPTTAAATRLGPTGFSAPGCCTALSSGASGLYFVTTLGSGTTLYSLNTATGAPSMIGPTNTGNIGALVFENGTLYAVAYRGGLYTLNTSTGQGTHLSESPGELWGLAAANTVVFGAPSRKPDASGSESPSGLARRIQVPANQAWTATGVFLKAGSVVAISATGTASMGGGWPPMPPEGRPPNCGGRSGFPAGDLPCWSLIGRVGEQGPIFYVGSGTTLRVPRDGQLFLGVNDDQLGDNSGYWTATVALSTNPMLQPRTNFSTSGLPGVWLGFANETSPQDRETDLHGNCGDFKRVLVPLQAGNSFTDLCRYMGKACEKVCDWEGRNIPCDAAGRRDGSRVVLCR